MKKTKTLVAFLVMLVMAITCAFAVSACTKKPTPHGCEHVCDVCGNCTTDCEEPECAEKCPGHGTPNPDPDPDPDHECEHVCDECGKCQSECEEDECAEKCPGHGNTDPDPDPDHKCEHVCDECGKCQSECEEPECEEKCECEGKGGDEEDEYPVLEAEKSTEITIPESGEVTYKLSLPVDGNYVLTLVDGDEVTVEYVEGGEITVGAVAKYSDGTVIVFKGEADTTFTATISVMLYTITLNVGEGTLPEGAKTTYKTDANGYLDLNGEDYLPVPNAKTHWYFLDWYDAETGGKVVVEDEYEFKGDVTIYARYGRDDGVWKDNGQTWVVALTRNTGNKEVVEYWLGSEEATVNLTTGDKLNLYIDGKLCTGIWITGLGVKTEVNPKPSVIEVTQDGDFKIFLKDYSGGAGTDYVVEFRTDTKGEEGSEDDIPVGAAKITIKIGSLQDITIYLVTSTGAAVTEAQLSNYCIYTFSGEIFGNWTQSTTKGLVKSEMTATGTAVPNGWIFRWGSNFSTQTANIEGVIKAGGTYVIKLPAANNGAASVTVIS